ncbi:hypothetical protein PM082_007025 [Marasmius tenuissimus]|nr:hypothetical protein PM082_007025 [Marasmius tenuissimus]
MHFGCREGELWMDTGRGVLCRGPKGPAHPYHLGLAHGAIENPVATADVFKEDVLIRYLASQNSQRMDWAFMQGMWLDWSDVYVPGWVDRPTVFCTLTNTPIAVANNVWSTSSDSLEERKLLGNGCTRFRLKDGHTTHFELRLNLRVDEWAWLPQASSVFHARGIPLEKNLGVFALAWPRAKSEGAVSESEDKRKHRLEEPIYLFFRPHFRNLLDGETSSLHHWSFQESGQPPLSPELCRKLGLPIELKLHGTRLNSHSWRTNTYKLIHQYQLSRGFDPATIDFARHIDCDDHIFRPINDSNRFKMVHEESALVNSRCEPPTSVNHVVDDLHRRPIAEEGGVEDRIHTEQDIHFKDNKTSNRRTVEETNARLDGIEDEGIEPHAENPMGEGPSLRTTDLPRPQSSSTRLHARSNFLKAGTRLKLTFSRRGRSLKKL